LWLQGWKDAPNIAKACLVSWQRLNPDYVFHALDKSELEKFLSQEDILRIFKNNIEPEALSDLIRIELLYQYGGVWVDSTAMCALPLSKWLPQILKDGFFAFQKPTPDRMIATWFLAASKGSYIIELWRQLVLNYWEKRTKRDQYFWIHNLFESAYRNDLNFRKIVKKLVKIPAHHLFHFGPNDYSLLEKPTEDHIIALAKPPHPVLKLTHKLSNHVEKGSLIEVLYNFGTGNSQDSLVEKKSKVNVVSVGKKILVTWYGTFKGHGTLGDLRSFECITAHLVSLGCQVMYTSSYIVNIPGSEPVSLNEVKMDDLNGLVFVCGPIFFNHQETRALFTKFASKRILGVAISLFPFGHINHYDPFDLALARQGGDKSYGDVAILSKKVTGRKGVHSKPVIGIALRGMQQEYGIENCMWKEIEDIVQTCLRVVDCDILWIDNHLTNAGISPNEIERLYIESDLVITTRYHGAVLAIKYEIPFIAIDQIKGGAKVFDLLKNSFWPYIYKIESINTSILHRVICKLLINPEKNKLKKSRQYAIYMANKTLSELDLWIESIRP
jgi:hypothetical protein